MNLDLLASDPAWKLGWLLLHSLWLILLIGLLTGFALLLAGPSPRRRYSIALTGLFSLYLPLAATWLVTPPRPSPVQASPVVAVTAPTLPAVPATEFSAQEPPVIPQAAFADPTPAAEHHRSTPPATASRWVETFFPDVSDWMSWVVLAWGIGVALLAVWNLGGWLLVQRLRSRATLPVSDVVQRQFKELRDAMRVSPSARLLQSLLVEVPLVIGWLRPVILLPASLATGLPSSQLAAILAHELAHVRRYDYLINLLQSLTETLLFYHPVVWWLSRQARIEREFCCDDAAVAVCGDRAALVQALAAVELSRSVPAYTLAMSGGLTLQRARRIMGLAPQRSCRGVVGLSAMLLVVALAFGWAIAPGQAEEPAEPPVEKNEQPKPPVQGEPPMPPQKFRLDVEYVGESDKPFYNFTFTTYPLTIEATGFHPVEEVEPDNQARIQAVRDWLKRSGFDQHARETVPEHQSSPRYLLRVTSGEQVRMEDLGWGLPTYLRLESLRAVLDDGKPETMQPLDFLLQRISGYTRIWTEPLEAFGLKNDLVLEKQSITAGQPLPVTLKITNTSDRELEYEHHLVSLSSHELRVLNQYGRPVPYLGGPAQLMSRKSPLAPGASAVIEAFDLAKFYYLRLPGKYVVQYDATGLRHSNVVEFTVTAGPEGSDDPVGRVLPLLRDRWILITDPNYQGKVRPGRNFEEVPGLNLLLYNNPTGYKPDTSLVWLWITDEQAKPREDQPAANEPTLPESRYLGKCSRWHLYASADELSLQRWPKVLEDVQAALQQPAPVGQRQPDAISRLVHQLSQTYGLWMNGITPILEQPATATPEQVLAEVAKKISFDAGRITEYKILTARTVTIDSIPDSSYTALLLDTNQGQKIVLMQYQSTGWWARFFDPPPAGEIVSAWGHPNEKVQLRAIPARIDWQFGEIPRLRLEVRNQGEGLVKLIPHIGSCEIEIAGRRYIWASGNAWGGRAVHVPPGETVNAEIDLFLFPGEQQSWVTREQRIPLLLTPGTHTVQVYLNCINGLTLTSRPTVITIAGPTAGDLDRMEYSSGSEVKEIKQNREAVLAAALQLLQSASYEATDPLLGPTWPPKQDQPQLRIRFRQPTSLHCRFGGEEQMLQLSDIVIPISPGLSPDYLYVCSGPERKEVRVFSKYQAGGIVLLQSLLFPQPEL